jgi:hypothetical protein
MTERQPPPRDLIVLTADKNTQFAIEGILSRYASLGIRPVDCVDGDYVVHSDRDPGVLRDAAEILRRRTGAYGHALVVMDREGSGRESEPRESIEETIESKLRAGGWDGRAGAVVIDPELEAWVWCDSPYVEEILGWRGRKPNLTDWLAQKGFAVPPSRKPSPPKDAFEAALREAKRPRSSALYRELAEKVGLKRCGDPAFLKLRGLLQKWFPAS